MNKQQYIESKKWKNNDRLLQPDTATKRCAVCEELKYSSEFADVPEYDDIDGKLPACTDCLKSRSNERNTKMRVLVANHTRKCGKCDTDKEISAFSYVKLTNTLNKTCKECVGSYWG